MFDLTSQATALERSVPLTLLYLIIIVHSILTFHLSTISCYYSLQSTCTADFRPAAAGLRPPVLLWLSQRGPVPYYPGPGELRQPLARLRRYRKGYLQIS